MVFASPIWLLAVVPWTVLALWMLWGQRERVGVPFLALWGETDARPKATRSVRPPPLAIALILLAILLAILAAASPAVSGHEVSPISIIVDRGITLSARDGDVYRYVQASRRLESAIAKPGLFFLLSVPGVESMADRARLLAALETMAPTAVDTSPDLEQAVLHTLHVRAGPVVVVTDKKLTVADGRVIVVPPAPLPQNVGIAHVAARDGRSPQVMIRLRNQSPATQASVIVSSDGQRVVERMIDLPPTMQAATAFVDVARLGETVAVALGTGDALSADDRAWLVRERGWPRIEPVGEVPPELARMIEAYRKLRPARDGARVVSIVDGADDAPGEAVILAQALTQAEADAAPEIADHPVTSGVAWAEVLNGARLGEARPPRGFLPIVSSSRRVAIAIRELPVRQVWIAVDAPGFSRRADFVIFWTNVFDWLGQGGDAFASHPIGLLGGEWQRITDGPDSTEPGLWPGVFRRGDGTMRAVNAPAVALPAPSQESDWRERLADMSRARPTGRTLTPYLLLAALACGLGAAMCWPSRGRANP